MTPKYKIWDTYRIGKTSYMVLNIDVGSFEFSKDTLCYYTYDFTQQKVRVFSVLGIDRKTELTAQ
jgi:hypothetical protein